MKGDRAVLSSFSRPASTRGRSRKFSHGHPGTPPPAREASPEEREALAEVQRLEDMFFDAVEAYKAKFGPTPETKFVLFCSRTGR
jgi:hypothetical protein